jgi:hypothetical protein
VKYALKLANIVKKNCFSKKRKEKKTKEKKAKEIFVSKEGLIPYSAGNCPIPQHRGFLFLIHIHAHCVLLSISDSDR